MIITGPCPIGLDTFRPGERANAQLKSWRILRKLRCSPSKAGRLVKAIAVLQNHNLAQAAHR